MSKLLTTLQAAKALNVSAQTLRRWEREGRIEPAERTSGGQRRYDLSKLAPNLFRPNIADHLRTVVYARVSSHDQKDDLERQKQVLELYCAGNGWTCFHCGETFTTPGGAADHFGMAQNATPGCVQKVELGGERGLIMALRRSEAHVDRLTAEVERMRQLVAEAWSEGYSDGVGDGQGYSSGRAKFADSDAKRALAETL